MTDTNDDAIRIILIDPLTLVRTGFRKLIENEQGMAVVGEATTETDALALAEQVQPDVILIEPDYKDAPKLDLINKLACIAPHARIILVTRNSDPHIHQKAVELGAVGIVRKDQTVDVLLKAITKVHAGELWLGHNLIANIIKQSRPNHSVKTDPDAVAMASLSRRERQVIVLVGQGLKNKQIASHLSISETTVRHHLTGIFSKLGVSDRMELIVYAYRHGLAALPK